MLRALRTAARTVLQWVGVIEKADLVARLVPDHPLEADIEPGHIYVIGGKGYQKWAYLRCPSDDTEIIQLCLQPNHRPRWTVTIDRLDRPTVYPSVRQLDGSFAHFWIKKGAVEWCADTGKSWVG